MYNKESDFYDTKKLFKLMLAYKKPIMVILCIVLFLSIFFSSPLFIEPLYKSTVVLYPTSTNSISKTLISSTNPSKSDILEFGEDAQTEQMLQILNSNKIRDKVIDKFDLMRHYKIKTTQKHPYTRLYKQYENRIRFKRTEYNAVKITVLDTDPALAAEIANQIAELFDTTMNAMQKEVALKAFQIVEAEYQDLKNQMQRMEDSLNVLRSLGIYDYESQVEMLTQQLAIELGKGNANGVKAIKSHLEVLGRHGGSYYAISEMLDHDRLQLSLVKTKYDEAKMDATQNIPHKFVVTTAYEAEQKSYPVRWIIVVVSLLSTLLLMMLAIAVIERIGNDSNKIKQTNSDKQK